MRTRGWVVALALLGSAATVEAQGTAHAYCDPMSRADMARLVRVGGSPKNCNAPIATIRSEYQKLYPTRDLSTNEKFASWIEQLVPIKCTEVIGQGTMRLGRVVIPKGKPMWLDSRVGYPRNCQPGEMLLCDNSLGVCVTSEYCWNPLLDKPAMPSREQPTTRLNPITATTTPIGQPQPKRDTTIIIREVAQPVYPEPRRSSWTRYIPWALGAATVGFLGYMCITDWCEEEDVTIQRVHKCPANSEAWCPPRRQSGINLAPVLSKIFRE